MSFALFSKVRRKACNLAFEAKVPKHGKLSAINTRNNETYNFFPNILLFLMVNDAWNNHFTVL